MRCWTDGRKELLITFRNEDHEHWAAARIGIVCNTSGSDSRDWALSGGGALSGLPSVGGVDSGREPSVRPCALVGPGVIRSGRRPARTSGLSWAAARQRRSSRRSSTVDAVGLFNACAIIRSGVSVAHVVGLVSNKPAEVTRIDRGICGVAIAPLGG